MIGQSSARNFCPSSRQSSASSTQAASRSRPPRRNSSSSRSFTSDAIQIAGRTLSSSPPGGRAPCVGWCGRSAPRIVTRSCSRAPLARQPTEFARESAEATVEPAEATPEPAEATRELPDPPGSLGPEKNALVGVPHPWARLPSAPRASAGIPARTGLAQANPSPGVIWITSS